LPDRFVIRYLDAQDQRVVAYEFDAQFRCLGAIPRPNRGMEG